MASINFVDEKDKKGKLIRVFAYVGDLEVPVATFNLHKTLWSVYIELPGFPPPKKVYGTLIEQREEFAKNCHAWIDKASRMSF